MQQQQSLAAATNVSIPEQISSSTGKLVYLYLGVSGGASVGDLSSDLGLGALTASAVAETLREKAVVERRRDGVYVTAGS
jgi:hypothetical protein